jgi:hypothetical protein
MPRGADMDRMITALSTAPARVMQAAAVATEGAVRRAVQSGYETRRDVYGATYQPAKDGHLPQMQRTGTLRNAYRYSITAGVVAWLVRVSEGTSYGQYLRDGTPKMKARTHIPQPAAPMPTGWDLRIRRALDAAMVGLP